MASARSEVGVVDHEEPVVAVDLGRTRRLAHHRHEAGAVLAERLRHELLEPEPERGHLGGQAEGELVAARPPRRPPSAAASTSAGLSPAAPSGPHASRPRQAAAEQRLGVDAGEQRGHDAEQRQRRVAAADVGAVLEHLGEAALAGQGRRARSRGR